MNGYLPDKSLPVTDYTFDLLAKNAPLKRSSSKKHIPRKKSLLPKSKYSFEELLTKIETQASNILHKKKKKNPSQDYFTDLKDHS